MTRILLGLAIVVGLLTAGCSDSEDGEPRALGHIHGLGVNPADGMLYAATHYGVYQVSGERDPKLLGDIVQDFMGFTVVGSDHFLGSGHPGEGYHNQPPSLGLIESTDGGRSWHSLSLNGEADFHALEYRHDRVYGYDSHSGRVMVSSDKRFWDRRAQIQTVDIAVSPRNPDELLATTPDGLLSSGDGALTFSSVDATPPLVFLSWPDQGSLVGVDPTGSVYSSDDSGARWQARRALGERPQAILAAGGGLVFVATDRAIHRSTNNGVTFESYQALDAH